MLCSSEAVTASHRLTTPGIQQLRYMNKSACYLSGNQPKMDTRYADGLHLHGVFMSFYVKKVSGYLFSVSVTDRPPRTFKFSFYFRPYLLTHPFV